MPDASCKTKITCARFSNGVAMVSLLLELIRTRRVLLVSVLVCALLVISNVSISFKGRLAFIRDVDQSVTKNDKQSGVQLQHENVIEHVAPSSPLPPLLNDHATPLKSAVKELAVSSVEEPINISTPLSTTNLSPQKFQNATRKRKKAKQESQKAPRKPLNILIIYPDDWRHDTLGCAGTQPVQTPFLDYMASKGIRFTHNCVTTSVCWISRATLFTGHYLSRHHSDRPIYPRFYNRWNETWPYLLRESGYWTGHIGKWQYANYSFVQECYNYTYLSEGFHWTPNPNRGPEQPQYIHSTDLYENVTLDFLRDRPKDRPFALTVAFYAPKAIGDGPDQWFPKNETLKRYENVTVPEPLLDGNTSFAKLPEFFKKTERTNAGRTRWVDRFGSGPQYQYSMRRYYALITEVDNAIKNIHKELETQGILNETLIIFTTDNGFFHGEHGLGGKWWPYQESIRVPLIIQDPRMPQKVLGKLDDSFTLNVDLAPTILNAANIKVPPGMQGRNIADLYLDTTATSSKKTSWRKEFFYEHPTHFGIDHIPSSSALVRKDFKYMVYPDWNVEQLFDLKNDPYEYNDLVNHSDYRKLVTTMRKRHDELKQQVV